MNRLFKLAVIGSALIVVVYSVYYYSNAYKYSSTNIYYVENQEDIEQSSFLNGHKVGKTNLIISSNQEAALTSAKSRWNLTSERPEAYYLDHNPRTTVLGNGVVAEGFDEAYTKEMIQKFHNIPPVLMDRESDGIVVKSIQFEHLMFPTYAMVNWKDASRGYKVFNFEPDSMPGRIEFYENGFEWHSGKEEYITVLNCKEGDDLEGMLKSLQPIKKPEVVVMPVVDFDIVNEYKEHLDLEYVNEEMGNTKKVIQSEGELKILIGPSLKQNNVYEIQNEGYHLEIKPPFVVFLTKEKSDKPYFFGAFVNEKLLLH